MSIEMDMTPQKIIKLLKEDERWAGLRIRLTCGTVLSLKNKGNIEVDNNYLIYNSTYRRNYYDLDEITQFILYTKDEYRNKRLND